MIVLGTSQQMVWIVLSWAVLISKLLWQYIQSDYFIDIL